MTNEVEETQQQEGQPEENPLYTDTHRLFVRAMLSHRVLTMDKAIQLFNQVVAVTRRSHQSAPAFAEAIAVINNELSNIDMLLKETRDEWTGVSMLVMMNTTEDPYVQTMTPYTPRELEYYRHMIEIIVKAPNETWAISQAAALQLGPSLKSGLTIGKTEELLNRLEEDGWLRVCSDGSYALAPRSIVELESYLCKTFGENHVHHCIICTEMVTRGKRCCSCSGYIHHHCFAHTAGNHACSHPCQYEPFGSPE